MAAGPRLKTHTEAFWRDEFRISEADLDFLTGLILEAGKPQSTEQLARALIAHHCRLEQEAAAREAVTSRVYRPMDSYQVGERLVFTALDFAEGQVIGLRPGHNPRYAPFSVIRVAFADGREREFAAQFDQPHPLNRPIEELTRSQGQGMTEEEAIQAFLPYVAPRLEAHLQGLSDWVRLNGQWFLSGLLPEVHVGHLNLAEAIIYEAGRPVTAQEMLAHLDLSPTASEAAQLFALNHALANDPRFDNVGTQEERIWYLRALEPPAALEQPAVLKPAFVAEEDDLIGLTMVDIVEEIGDELDFVEGAIVHPARDFRFQLNFPHLYAGTAPAGEPLLRFLGQRERSHFPITIVDSRTGKRFEAWVVPAHRYLCGLGEWYASTGMTVGAEIALSPTGEPFTLVANIATARGGRSQWVRTATVEDGRLVLQIQRASVAVRCDPNMLIDVPNKEAIAQLMAHHEEANTSLFALVRMAFLELAKLNSQGYAHAKSIYAVVNMLRRSGAVPIFAILTRHACYDPVGDGQWAFDQNLVGRVYDTPEEMMERPLSARSMRARDQVTRYLAR